MILLNLECLSILCEEPSANIIIQPRVKLIVNIRNDVAETVNLVSVYPEKVKEMALEVERFKHSIKDLKPHPGKRKPKGYVGIPLGVPGE